MKRRIGMKGKSEESLKEAATVYFKATFLQFPEVSE
jgi:hypothetical protein